MENVKKLTTLLIDPLFFVPLLFLFLDIHFIYSQGWQKIYDSGNFGINKLTVINYQNNSNSIFLQKGCYVQGSQFGCSVISGSSDYIRLDRRNNSFYIPYGTFLKSSYCQFSIGGNHACWCEPLDFFTFSPKDSLFLIKYYKYDCYFGSNVKTFISYNGGISSSEIFNTYSMNGLVVNTLNDSIIITGVNGIIYRSTNRGNTWNPHDTIMGLKTIENGGYFVNNPSKDSDIFAVSNNSMYLSTDFGNSFSQLDIPALKIMKFDRINNIIFGVDTTRIYRSTNHGLNWSTYEHNLYPNTFEINPENSNIIYLGNNSGLHRTTNGGMSWSLYNNSFSPSFNVIGLFKDALTADTLFVATKDAFYEVWNSHIIETNILPNAPILDSPKKDTTVFPPLVTLNWNKIHNAQSYNVLVCRDSTFPSWNLDFNQTIADSFFNIPNVYGSNRYFWKVRSINNAGSSSFSPIWNFRTFGGPRTVIPILPLNNAMNLSIPVSLICSKAIFMSLLKLNENSIELFQPITYVFDIVRDTVTLSGEIVRYLNDTINVENELMGSSIYYWRVRAYNDYGTSAFGSWWKFSTSPIGIKSISLYTPKAYKLYCNYPNPFNPATFIKFDIPKTSLTKLRIFNILGEEIFSTQNQVLVSGTYEFNFIAIDLPSGVYYYRLTAGNYSETRKMVLIK